MVLKTETKVKNNFQVISGNIKFSNKIIGKSLDDKGKEQNKYLATLDATFFNSKSSLISNCSFDFEKELKSPKLVIFTKIFLGR